ncbi:hypothetical protein AGDE_09839 [Angomonas deanei]|uniref:Uncharacterized protein n=1 Tax=Angomonas deanei TaxID=59799 RepID=A0A7G2C7P0_9TRYP|nr:hypothetical protein AGDE_09839 [Angomonas deanei]CAD2215124.1 hypothetical protein, conserved [Angomonas deanei]|eukprot:EPY29772.1 hypothetical protein AGDE_09839 [Angomonas deanei]
MRQKSRKRDLLLLLFTKYKPLMTHYTPANEAYISGMTMSQFISAAYACVPARKYVFDLFGYYDKKTVVTDISEETEKLEVIITGALPQSPNPQPIENSKHIGYLSISKSPVHKLSYRDSQLLHKKNTESTRVILLFITVEPHTSKTVGTSKVDFTVFQTGPTDTAAPRALPLKIDNIVNPLVGFTKIADLYRRNETILFEKKKSTTPSETFPSFDRALNVVTAKVSEKYQLIDQILALQQILDESS